MSHKKWIGRQAVASLEFAIVCPILLVVVAGLADFPLAFWKHNLIETGVANGAAYAFQQMQANLSQGQAVSASSVQVAVEDAINLPNASVTVTPPTLDCMSTDTSTSPPTANLVSAKAGSSCPDGSPPGTYISITVSYKLVPLMPFYSEMAGTVITETANVRAY